MNIHEQVISSGKIICEGTNLCPINTKSHYYVPFNMYKSRNILQLHNFINGDVNFMIYGVDNVITSVFNYSTRREFSILSQLFVLLEEHENL